MKQYENFISLGYFCSIALELEKMGLRSTSSPFDWCKSDFEGVIKAIEDKFDYFLDYDQLLQSQDDPDHYFNAAYKIWFFHDFDKYRPLNSQIENVQAKYTRRIERFYKNIKNPTLFIRYISNEELTADGKSVELEYIEKHIGSIISLLKSFNENNDIIFIANSGIESDIITVYNVNPDAEDTVAREPLHKNGDLKKMFDSFDYEYREKNISIFQQKESRKNNFWMHKAKSISNIMKSLLLRPYVHEKTICDMPGNHRNS